MRVTELRTIATMCGGVLLQGEAEAPVRAVSTDTRTIEEGALYVALKGERFDGHDFVAQAIDAGAAGVLVSDTVGVDGGVIEVEDTLLALQRLAHEYRRTLDVQGVGITGSSGKTSTKDMILAVAGTARQVRGTKGNLNNHIGLPLTLLAHETEDEVGVWEMGMSNPGEIAPLAAIAEPDIGVITNIGTAHLENMGSVEAIAAEKGALVAALGASGCVVLNANDPWTETIAARCAGDVLRAGIDAGDVVASEVVGTGTGSRFRLRRGGESVLVELPLPGRHMVQNATLAAGVGVRLGLSLEQIGEGLSGVALTGGRLQVRKGQGFTVLDDTYNANPDSMRAALKALGEFPATGRRVVVFGKMAELGEVATAEHVSLGGEIVVSNTDVVLVVGEDARGILEGVESGGGRGRYFETPEAAGSFLGGELKEGDVVLVKGSRSAAMERVIGGLGLL